MDVIIYPCWDWSKSMLVKGATDLFIYIHWGRFTGDFPSVSGQNNVECSVRERPAPNVYQVTSKTNPTMHLLDIPQYPW